MTCEDFKVMSAREPETCTVAERAAWYTHVTSCPSCREWKSRTPCFNSKLTDAEAQILVYKDITDPEGYYQKLFRAGKSK